MFLAFTKISLLFRTAKWTSTSSTNWVNLPSFLSGERNIMLLSLFSNSTVLRTTSWNSISLDASLGTAWKHIIKASVKKYLKQQLPTCNANVYGQENLNEEVHRTLSFLWLIRTVCKLAHITLFFFNKIRFFPSWNYKDIWPKFSFGGKFYNTMCELEG